MHKIIRIALTKTRKNGFWYTPSYFYETFEKSTTKCNDTKRWNYWNPLTSSFAKYQNRKKTNPCHRKLIFISAGLLSFFTNSDETPEDKLITNIKRGILSIQRKEYAKAESMLHLALRMAQDLNHQDGMTYIYDVMANLALEVEQFTKAKKLFITVMQRLLQDGYKEDDPKMLHISSKVASIEHSLGNLEISKQGYHWTLEKIKIKLQTMPDDQDLMELYGLTKNGYALLLMSQNLYKEAKQFLIEAYEIYSKIHGENTLETVDLLNNLAVVCINNDDLKSGETYLMRAIELAKLYPELYDTGIYQANYGFLLLKKGLLDEAKKVCAKAWRQAQNADSKEGIQQSEYCLKQLKVLIEQAEN